jgi:hypothetical protein
MIIYVITSGDYSDYHIEKVFIDKEKAEKYVEYQNRYIKYDECRLEEYDTEEQQFEPVVNVSLHYYLNKPNLWEQYSCWIESKTTLEENIKDFEVTFRWDSYHKTFEFYMKQTLQIDIDNIETFKNKYKKVCEDLAMQIKSLMEIENWNEEMIQNWLKEKYKGYNFHN